MPSASKHRDIAIAATCAIGSSFLALTAIMDWKRRNDFRPQPKDTRRPAVGRYGDLYKVTDNISDGRPQYTYVRPANAEELAAAQLSAARGGSGLFHKTNNGSRPTYVMPYADAAPTHSWATVLDGPGPAMPGVRSRLEELAATELGDSPNGWDKIETTPDPANTQLAEPVDFAANV